MGTLTDCPTLAWCLATKAEPAEPAPAVLPHSGSPPSWLTSARPRSSSGSARCPRDMLKGAPEGAEPAVAAGWPCDCCSGAEAGACKGVVESDWKLRRPSRAEVIGATKAVGAGTAGTAGPLPARPTKSQRAASPLVCMQARVGCAASNLDW